MTRHLTPVEAWDDFYQWAKRQPFWLELGKKEKRALYDAQADRMGQRGQKLGIERIERTLNDYAPGRYTFQHYTTVTLNDGQ